MQKSVSKHGELRLPSCVVHATEYPSSEYFDIANDTRASIHTPVHKSTKHPRAADTPIRLTLLMRRPRPPQLYLTESYTFIKYTPSFEDTVVDSSAERNFTARTE